jgi:FkbM family methyltransferase
MKLQIITDYFYPYRILDIGANIGQFHTLAKQNFPSSFIFSIEANKECEAFLKVLTDNYYIGMLAKDNSEYEFFKNKTNPISTGNSLYKELTPFYSQDKLDIIKEKGIMLDHLFESNSEFDLIKIDTQGSELDIITGGQNLCKKAKGILLEVSLTPYNENAPLYDEVIQYMGNFGFEKTQILDEVYNHGSHQQDILFINKEYNEFINRSNK